MCMRCGSLFARSDIFCFDPLAMASSWKDEMNKLLGDTSAGAAFKLEKVIHILKENQMTYKGVLKCSEVLCHPQNRGGSMIQPHDSHLKGEAMKSSGIRKSLLEVGSYCFELAPPGPQRDEQVQKILTLLLAVETC